MKLTNESELLISYFTKNKCVHSSDPNKHTTEIIRKLYLDIYHAYVFVQKLKHAEGNRFYKPKAKSIQSVSQITKPASFDFQSFPEQIQEQIKELMLSELEYSFSM